MYRKIWTALTAGVHMTLTHLYNGNTMTDCRYEVCMRFEISEGGKERGREVDVKISPDRARRYAAELTRVADLTDKRNAEAGNRPE